MCVCGEFLCSFEFGEFREFLRVLESSLKFFGGSSSWKAVWVRCRHCWSSQAWSLHWPSTRSDPGSAIHHPSSHGPRAPHAQSRAKPHERGQVPRQNSDPQLDYPLGCEGRIKTNWVLFFFWVCVCMWCRPISKTLSVYDHCKYLLAYSRE